MGSVDLPPFLRDKMKQNIESQNGEELPPFLKKKETPLSVTQLPSSSSSGKLPSSYGSGKSNKDLVIDWVNKNSQQKPLAPIVPKTSILTQAVGKKEEQKLTDQEIYNKAQEKIGKMMYGDSEDWKDPIGALTNESLKNIDDKTNQEALRIGYRSVAPDGYEAKKALEFGIWDKFGKENATSNFVRQKANQYDKTVEGLRNLVGDQRYDIKNAAIKAFANNNPVFKKELKASGIDLGDVELAEKLPDAKVGQILDWFTNNPDTKTFAEKENPNIAPLINDVQQNIFKEHPEYAINQVANKVSQARIREMKTNPLFDWTESDKDYQMTNEIAEKILTPEELNVYNNNIRDRQSDYLDKPSAVGGIAQGISNTFKGIGELAKQPFTSNKELMWDKWNQEASNVSANPEGFLKYATDTGNVLGLVMTMGATGNVTGLGSVPNTVMTFSGEAIKHGREKYPDSPVKAATSAVFETALYAALSKDIFPTKGINQAFSKVRPEISNIVEKLSDGAITKEAARQEASTIFKKMVDIAGGTLAKDAKITAELTGIQVLQRDLDKVMMDKETFKEYHPDDEIPNSIVHNFLSNAVLAGITKVGEQKRANRVVEETIYNAALNPKQTERLIDNESLNMSYGQTQELKSNLRYASKVVSDLQAKGFSDKAQKAFLFQSLRDKVAKEAAEATTDPTLQKEQKEISKEANEIKEQIMQGKDPDNIVTESEQKKIEEQEKSKTELERLTFDRDIALKKVDDKIEQTDGRESEANRIKLTELKEEKRRINEDYEKKVAKLKPTENVQEEKVQDISTPTQEKEVSGDLKAASEAAWVDIQDPNIAKLFAENPEQGLKEAAQQLNASKTEAETARKVYGDTISDIALKLYPKEKVTEPSTVSGSEKLIGRKPIDDGKFVRYNPDDVLPLLPDYKPTNTIAVEDYVNQVVPNDASVEAYKTVPLDAIQTSEKIENKDREAIDKIKEGIKNGDDIPPLVLDFSPVIKNGETYKFGLMDGHHRYIAYKELGIKEVPAAIVTSREHYTFKTNDTDVKSLFQPQEQKPSTVTEQGKEDVIGIEFEWKGKTFVVKNVESAGVVAKEKGNENSPLKLILPVEKFNEITGKKIEAPKPKILSAEDREEAEIIRKAENVRFAYGKENGRQHIDKYIADGYDKLISEKIGAVNKYFLNNEKSGFRLPVSGDLRKYAELALKKLSEPKTEINAQTTEAQDNTSNKQSNKPTEEGIGTSETPIEPPKGTEPPKEEAVEGSEGKKKALLNKLYNAKKTPEAAKEGFKREGLEYEPKNQTEAQKVAEAIVDEAGIEDAVLRARAQDFGGDVNTLVQTTALSRLAEMGEKEKDPVKKEAISQQFKEIGVELDKWLRKQGQGISALNLFYKKDPLGFVLTVNEKKAEEFKEWAKPKEKSWKEFFEELKKDPEFEKLFKENVKEELKKERATARKERIRKVDEWFDKAKKDIEGKGGAVYSTIIPPKVMSAALEGMRKAYHAGEKVAELIQNAIDEISAAVGEWDKEKFRKEWEEKLKEKLPSKKALTEEELKAKVLDKFRKKLKGLNEDQKDEVIKKSFKELVENGALEYDDFKKIIARVTGRGEVTPEEAAKLKELVKKTNSVDDAATKLREEKTKESMVAYDKAMIEAGRAARELNTMLDSKPDILKRLNSLMQLNTLGIPALVNNPIYNVFNQMFVRFPVAATNNIIDRGMWLASKMMGKNYQMEWNTIEMQRDFWKGLQGGSKESLEQFLTGLNRQDYLQKELYGQQIRPLQSLRDLYKHATGEKRLTKRQLIDKSLQGTVGIPAEIVARVLNIGDKPQRFGAESAQGGAFADALGLTKHDINRDIFKMFPREEAFNILRKSGLSEKEAGEKADYIKEAIEKEGKRSTFQQDNLFTDGVNVFFGKLFGGKDSGAAAVAKTIAISPYIKIPSNAFWSYYNLINPEIAMLQSLYHGGRSFASRGKEGIQSQLQLREARYWLGHAVTGIALRGLVTYLVSQGVYTPSNEEDDTKKEREGEGNYEPQGTVNLTKLWAIMRGEDPSKVKNSVTINNKWFGTLGVMGNAIAQKQEDMTPEQKEKQSEFWNVALGGMEDRFLKDLEQGVLSNSSSLIGLMTDKSGYQARQYGNQMINMVTNIVQPAAIAQISKAQLDEIPSRRSDTFLGELKQSMLQRSSWLRKATGQYPESKIGIWGAPLKRPGNTVERLFGINEVNKDNFAQPIYEDVKRTGDIGFFPPAVMPILNGQKLNTEQYRALQIEVGKARQQIVAPYINDMANVEGFNKKYSEIKNDEDRKMILQYLYYLGRANGLANFYQKFSGLRKKEKTVQDEINAIPFEVFKAINQAKNPTLPMQYQDNVDNQNQQ